jgi:hypothetical protein
MNNSRSEQQRSGAANPPWLAKLRKARFRHLLFSLSLLIFLSPVVGIFSSELGRTIASLLVIWLLAAVLVAAALAVSDDRRNSIIALVLAAACLILTLLGHPNNSPGFRIVQYLLTIMFLSHVIRLIVRTLFRLKTVNYDTIAASLCGYLLIGVVYAVAYSLVVELDDTAIAIGRSGSDVESALHFGDHHTASSLYFSFVTLTTLGYGDITPVSMPARMLTTTEALLGQLYLIVLVARLVGLHISNEMSSQQPDRYDELGQEKDGGK